MCCLPGAPEGRGRDWNTRSWGFPRKLGGQARSFSPPKERVAKREGCGQAWSLPCCPAGSCHLHPPENRLSQPRPPARDVLGLCHPLVTTYGTHSWVKCHTGVQKGWLLTGGNEGHARGRAFELNLQDGKVWVGGDSGRWSDLAEARVGMQGECGLFCRLSEGSR